MENGYNYKFDLIELLKIKALEIRSLANDNPSLRVGEYFNSLSKVIENTVKVLDALYKMTSLKATEKEFQTLAEIKPLLAEIGCFCFFPEIDEIISISKRGHNKFAADYAKKLLDDLFLLTKKIKAIRESEEPKMHEQFPDDIESTEDPEKEDELSFLDEKQILKKVLHLLDHKEATRKLRILVIDDAPSIIKSVHSLLKDEYKVYGLTNPRKVEQFLRQITPDLFLLDYQMPEINGFDLVPVIRKFEEHFNTPIIFLTSLGTLDQVSAAYALGASDFIVKPFQDTILREKIAKHIVRKKNF